MCRQRVRIAPGVELLTERTDRFKSSVFSVVLTVPLLEETATAYALIPEVLYRGSCNYPDISSLSAATDSLYGAAMEVGVRQRGECQCICLRCSFIEAVYTFDGCDLLAAAIDLVAEILLNPFTEGKHFKNEYVEGEGKNLADRIRSRINDKAEWALFRLIREMCDGEAYAIDKLGDAEVAVALSAEQLWKYYQKLLSSAKVTFYYNGSCSCDRVESLVRHAFNRLFSPRQMTTECVVLTEPVGVVKQINETMDVTQGKLSLGFRTGGIVFGHSQFPALLVFNALYGGVGTSKLFMNVRERMGLCYSVISMIDKLKGIMVVTAGVESCDIEAAKSEILEQLACIRRGEITSRELKAAVMSVSCAITGHKDSQGQMEDDAVTGSLTLGEWIDNDVLLKAVERVTVEQVVEVASAISLDTVYSLTAEGGAS